MPAAASPPEAATSEDKETSALWSFVKRNPFVALWNVALIVGAVIFTLYFAEIRFIPDFDVSASLGLVVVVALVGTVLILVSVIFLVLPGVSIGPLLKIWVSPSDEKVAEGKTRQSEKTMPPDASIKILPFFLVLFIIFFASFCIIHIFAKSHHFWLLIFAVPLAIIFILISVQQYYAKNKSEGTQKPVRKRGNNYVAGKIYAALGVIGEKIRGCGRLIINSPISVTLSLVRVVLSEILFFIREKIKKYWGLTINSLLCVIGSYLWIVLSVPAFLIVSSLFLRTSLVSHYSSLWREIFIIGFVFSLNLYVVAYIFKTDARAQLMVKLAMIILGVFLLLPAPFIIPNAIINRLSLGNIKSINVTATAAGCQALRLNHVQILALAGTACEAKGLQLFSRIGTQFLLKTADAGALAPNSAAAHKPGTDKPAQEESARKKTGADNHALKNPGAKTMDKDKSAPKTAATEKADTDKLASKKPCAKKPGACFVLKKADVLSWSVIDPGPIFTSTGENGRHDTSKKHP